MSVYADEVDNILNYKDNILTILKEKKYIYKEKNTVFIKTINDPIIKIVKKIIND